MHIGDVSPLIATATAFVALFFARAITQAYINRRKLHGIPAVGHAGILTSYIGAFQFFTKARYLIQEGYDRYPGSLFRVAAMSEWIIIVNDISKVDEIRKASEDVLSFNESLSEILQISFTLGQEIHDDTYHLAAIRSLTRNIATGFGELHDEMVCAFNEHLPCTDDWSRVNVLPEVLKIISRVSNRFFVGLPLCREPEYRDINIQFAIDVVKAATVIGLFPAFLRPVLGHILTEVPNSVKRTMRHLRPMIEERIAKSELYGKDWPDKPNDLITWLLEYAEDHRRSTSDITRRILTINFGAINTTAMAFTRVLIDLATHPEYVPEMRQEVEDVIGSEGWSKAALQKLDRIDSFIKESQRMGGSEALLMHRKVMKDFRFSDGTLIPKGNSVAVPNMAIHHDKNVYTNPKTFDGLRFMNLADEKDAFRKNSMVALATDYIIFGNGRSACPGRFFAVTELKTFLAHVLLNYDVALDESNPVKTLWHKYSSFPDPNTILLFRKRRNPLQT